MSERWEILHEPGAGCEWTLRVNYPDGNFNNAGYLYEQGKDYIAALEAEVARLRDLLAECDIFLRIHAGPQNQLKADVQAALRPEDIAKET